MIRTIHFTPPPTSPTIVRAMDGLIDREDAYLRMRLSGKLEDICHDLFFLTHEEELGLTRIWMGYGRHDGAVANWGAVYTNEAHRGRGYCARTLDYCFPIIESLPDRPLALMCSAGTVALTELYRKYGFVPALRGKNCGPLYRPCGDGPSTFQEFCADYFTPTEELRIIKADFGWRNEIDCLLRFALWDLGEPFGIGGVEDLLTLLMTEPDRARIVLTAEGKCAGWMVDGGVQLHPRYRHLLPGLGI